MIMDIYDKVIELAKRRGFLWPSFELYGGAAGFYDYGPLGATLKRRIENIWREMYVINEGYMEIEGPTVGVEDVFIASGHVGGFSDPITVCAGCAEPFRADHLVEGVVEYPDTLSTEQLTQIIRKHNIKCPECEGALGDVNTFNLMFSTTIGPGSKRTGYMRPETAQGMFVNFQRLSRYYREKLPFGATQIGKSYRNEISPRQGVIRLREFTQAECEIFIDPKEKGHSNFGAVADDVLVLLPAKSQESGDGSVVKMTARQAVDDGLIAHEFLAYQVALTQRFLLRVGIDAARLRFRQHQSTEMAHYAIDCWDAEIQTGRFGWVETVGIADRTDYDLMAHAKHSKTELAVYVAFDKPQEVTTTKMKPNMGAMGPRFKGKAKAISDALKELDVSSVSGDVTVNVEGEDMVVTSDLFEVVTATEVVHGKRQVPHVIEPSYGIDRIFYCLMEHAFREEVVEAGTDADDDDADGGDSGEGQVRIALGLKSEVAAVQVAVLPLLTREELMGPARQIVAALQARKLLVNYDDSGTVGKRYRRNDEIGTPYCVTIDYETIENVPNTVTVRDRDSMKQILSLIH